MKHQVIMSKGKSDYTVTVLNGHIHTQGKKPIIMEATNRTYGDNGIPGVPHTPLAFYSFTAWLFVH